LIHVTEIAGNGRAAGGFYRGQQETGMAHVSGAIRGLRRLEGFSDAVFAIALTLLVVETKPPGTPGGPPIEASLWHAIAEQWREHLALALSFFAIGVYWLQHHYTGRIYVKSDHGFSAINLGFLFAVMFLPYPVRIWAFQVGTPHEASASLVLTLGLMVPALFWMGKWRLAPDFVRQMGWRYGTAALLAVAAVPLALAAPRAGVALTLAILLYFVLPQPGPRYRPGMEPREKEVTAE
jgi:uncharacterized membrane protein